MADSYMKIRSSRVLTAARIQLERIERVREKDVKAFVAARIKKSEKSRWRRLLRRPVMTEEKARAELKSWVAVWVDGEKHLNPDLMWLDLENRFKRLHKLAQEGTDMYISSKDWDSLSL